MEQDSLPATSDGGSNRSRDILVSSTASDSHTWNLIFLQLTLEELGHRVHNLGSCVPQDLLVARCLARRPELIVLSSMNGHGYQDGLWAIEALRSRPELVSVPVVIGGKLGIGGPDGERVAALLAAGFDAVYEDSAADVDDFRAFVQSVRPRALA